MNDYQKIKDYLNSELPDEEMQIFREEILSSPKLAEKVKGMKGLMIMEREERRDRIREQLEGGKEETGSKKETVLHQLQYYAPRIAAAILFIITINFGWQTYKTNAVNKDLASWIDSFPKTNGLASTSILNNVNDAIKLANQKEYKKAAFKLQKSKEELSSAKDIDYELKQMLRIYLVSIYLIISDCDKAQQELMEFEKKDTSNYLKKDAKTLKSILGKKCF